MERLAAGMTVRHFKGAYYVVHDMNITNTETKERMVLYSSLTTGLKYVRPYDMFMSEVDHDKYPSVTQKYRFECTYVADATAETR